MLEFLFYFWLISGLIGFFSNFFIDGLKEDLGKDSMSSLFFASLFLGPISLIIAYSAHREDTEWERESIQRKAKLKATKEKKLKTAVDEYPRVMNEISADFIEIDNLDTNKLINFYKKIDKICGYYSFLDSSQIDNKSRLKEILIYSRLNVLSFYEQNSIKGSEKLAKKIASTIKALK
jgi:hypothetical protein